MSQRPDLWALLVAIDEYPNKVTHPPVGAIVDSKNVFQYLIDDMRVPSDHIVRLRDAEATRTAIISNFQMHLVHNDKIKKGWTVVQGAGDHSDDKVEVILPHDEGVEDPETGLPTYAIPDRTLAALIDLAAARHGDNITVVLDCCSSGHGTRADLPVLFKGERVVCRGIDEKLLAPLPLDLDHYLVSTQGLSVHGSGRRGRLRALGTNHVLLAACQPREQAQGTVEHGGFLTVLWLLFMKGDYWPRTYAEAIKFISRYLKTLYDQEEIPNEQHPQCEGTVRERIIFEETMIEADHFNATKVVTSSGTGSVFEVDAGEIHGVEKGTEFEIYGLDGSLAATKLGIATSTRVDGRSSTVVSHHLAGRANFVAYSATIVHTPTLNYTVHIDSQTSPAGGPGVHSTRELLSKALTGVHPECVSEVVDPDGAALEVRLEVEGDITLRRLDPLMRSLRNITPQIVGDGLKPTNLAAIFRGIARFNYFLPLTNQKHPLADEVSLDVCRLIKQDDNSGVFPVRPVDETFVVPTVNDVTGERQVTDEDDYAIILHSSANMDIYVQAWYFDPDEYSITPLYRPANTAQATLPRGGKLQIGASTELPWTLTYYVPEKAQTATLFLKVFLTDGFVNLRSLQQAPLIGPDAVGDRYPGKGDIETKGLWDTIVLPITVVRAQDGSV